MDEHKRIESVVQHAVDTRLSGLTENPWMAQRVLAASKGEDKVKKKISVGLLFLIIAILSIGLAVAASTNLFELFAKVNGSNYLLKVDHATQFYDSQTITIPQDDHFSQAEFTVNQSYYDGQTLIIAYTLSEEWIPSRFPIPSKAFSEYGDLVSEGYLDMPKPQLGDILSAEDISAFNQKCKQDGEVLLEGWSQSIDYYSIKSGESEFDASGSNIVHMPDGTTIGYAIFAYPLPQEVQDQDAVSVEFTFRRDSFVLYENESGFYSKDISSDHVQIPLTIPKNAKAVEKLTGSLELEDGCITALVTISAVDIKAIITISASAEAIEALSSIPPENFGYDLYAGDEKCTSPDAQWYVNETSITTNMSFRLPEDTENLTLVPSYTTSETEDAQTLPLSRGN